MYAGVSGELACVQAAADWSGWTTRQAYCQSCGLAGGTGRRWQQGDNYSGIYGVETAAGGFAAEEVRGKVKDA